MKYFDRSPFVPVTERPAFTWPNKARLAVWITNNVEYFREDSTGGVGLTTAKPAQPPDIANYTWRDFGPRVGFWRLAKLLKEFDLPVSVALNAEACQYYPQVVKACIDMGWELMGHGRNNNEHLNGKTLEEERAIIGETLATIKTFSGKPPIGWLGPGVAETVNSLDLLAEAGIRYVADWVNDEQPTWLNTIHGPIGSVPTSTEINDLIGVVARHYTGPELAQIIIDQFDELYEAADESGRMMCIVLHSPFSGAPFRIRHLRRAFAHIRSKKDVWFATAGEIWAHYAASCPAGAARP